MWIGVDRIRQLRETFSRERALPFLAQQEAYDLTWADYTVGVASYHHLQKKRVTLFTD